MTNWYLIIGHKGHYCNVGFLFSNKTFDIYLEITTLKRLVACKTFEFILLCSLTAKTS